MAKTYSEKLKDPRWQRKRLEVFNRDNFTCQDCGNAKKTLHVHHKNYYPGKEPWEYNNNNLITLCFECHESEEVSKGEVYDAIHDLLLMGKNHGNIHDVLILYANGKINPYEIGGNNG